jgi:hypothetical protein
VVAWALAVVVMVVVSHSRIVGGSVFADFDAVDCRSFSLNLNLNLNLNLKCFWRNFGSQFGALDYKICYSHLNFYYWIH